MIKIRLKLGPFLGVASRPPRPRGAQGFCMLLVRPPGNVVAASLELRVYDAALSVEAALALPKPRCLRQSHRKHPRLAAGRLPTLEERPRLLH